MKKRTKAKKQKLNNLLVLLILAAVLLIMSTYAWFTANRTVNIEAIDVKVATSSGLQISADGIEWKTVLSRKDLEDAHKTYAAAVNQMPDNMAPVSTALLKETNNENRLAMFYGKVEADLTEGSSNYGKYVLTGIKQTDKESSTVSTDGEYDRGYYMAFDVFLKSGNDENDLYMSGSVVEQQKNAANEYVPATTEKGIANAARVALIAGQNTDSDAVETIQGLGTNGNVMMWEPNYDAHTQHALDNANDLGWASGLNLNAGVGGDYVEYAGIQTAFETPVLLKDATEADSNFAKVAPTWKTTKDEVPNMPMPKTDGVALKGGVTKYRIYLWVEGQDIDCENFASGTYLQYDLGFSLDSYATPTAP